LKLPASRLPPDSPDFPYEIGFLVLVILGNRLEIEIKLLKFIEDLGWWKPSQPSTPRFWQRVNSGSRGEVARPASGKRALGAGSVAAAKLASPMERFS
jgi:hypothetical protein